LGSVPLISEPFQRVAVDIVGPIKPTTERGHRYILVLVDYSTRYPEAVPMITIETESVAEALLGMYSKLGFPKEVLTDQGSQFVSGMMREVSRLLSIRRLTTTPYHAMCNGLCEKFNGTLKAMLKKMCQERPRDWDRYIDPLLFAYREAPQESTGFSPSELLYGRTVRGPMRILRELWTNESEVNESKTVYQYVIDLQERLEQTCQLARDELQKSRKRYSMYYNKKARVRDLKVGEEVLLLLPTDLNKLLMQWKGPFPIIEKVSTMNYKIDLGHRVKTFHANLLKKYQRRSETMAAMSDRTPDLANVCEIVCTAVIEEDVPEEVSTSGSCQHIRTRICYIFHL
jgi:transposase InsO family protein